MAYFQDTVKSEGDSFFSFATEGFKYNLQVLPDVLLSATLLFSVLFQSMPMAFLGTGMILLHFIHKGLAEFSRLYIPNMTYQPSDYTKCSGRFPGATYGMAFNMAKEGIFSTYTDGWPSYYSTFMGFLAGWIGALPALYSEELHAVGEKKAASAAGLIILACLLVLIMIYRIQSECEGFMSTSLGLLAGFLISLVLVFLAAWATDRRGTNMLGLPLIRNKAADGKPIYVCERPINENSNQ
jgi:hypothetical protein